MKNIPQANCTCGFDHANFGVGSVISAGTIHDLRRVKVPGTGPLWNPWSSSWNLLAHGQQRFGNLLSPDKNSLATGNGKWES